MEVDYASDIAFAALAAVLALLLVSCGGTKDKPVPTEEDAPGKAAYHKISAEEAYEMMISQEIVVVDVRTREEYDGGHIENAVLVPNESIGSEMPETLPDKAAISCSMAVVSTFMCRPWSFLLPFPAPPIRPVLFGIDFASKVVCQRALLSPVGSVKRFKMQRILRSPLATRAPLDSPFTLSYGRCDFIVVAIRFIPVSSRFAECPCNPKGAVV